MPVWDHFGAKCKLSLPRLKEYLKIHITGKLTQSITDPVHLRQKLLWISKQLPTRLSLYEDPHFNIWHYYRFLTMNPVIHGGKLILMIRIPLIDLDSVMNVYKIYNLPIYNHGIGKSLQYVLEGTNLAITKVDKYGTILSDMEFIQCTLADGGNSFNVLWQMDISVPWILAFTMLTWVSGVWLPCFTSTVTKLTIFTDLPFLISLNPRPITLTRACGLSLLKSLFQWKSNARTIAMLRS